MTIFFLVRHAAHDFLDKVLVGRTPGISLNGEGDQQARRLAERLADEELTAIESSPQARALETACAIALASGLSATTAGEIDEIDFGDWMGRPFAELEKDPAWLLWNELRSSAAPPRGESMQELQHRVVKHLDRLADECPDGRIAVVSHAGPIRAILLHALRARLDDWRRIEIAPAEVRVVSHCGKTLALADGSLRT